MSKKAESVKVIVRCRPLNSKEKAEGYERVVDMDVPRGVVSVRNPKSSLEPPKQFTFDSVYDWELYYARTGGCYDGLISPGNWTKELLQCPQHDHPITGFRVYQYPSQTWILSDHSCSSLSINNIDFMVDVGNCQTPSTNGWPWGDTGVLIEGNCSHDSTSWPGPVTSCGSPVEVRVTVHFDTPGYGTFIMSCYDGSTWHDIDSRATSANTRWVYIRN